MKIYNTILVSLLTTVATWAQPLVNLGSDVAQCGGTAVLDAGNAGATFLWSTGATSQQLTAAASGAYWVQVTDGSGTGRDTVNVDFGALSALQLRDTVLCAGGRTVAPMTMIINTLYRWFDAPTGGNLVNTGATYSSNFQSPATYFIDALQPQDTILAGYTTLPTTSPSGYYAIPDTRGLIFDILQPLLLMSVEIPVQGGALSATLEIRSSANALVYSRPVSLVTGTNTVAINFELPAANGYRIVLSGLSGAGTLHVGGGGQVTYPRTASGFRLTSGLLSGSANTSFHFFFYNFRVSSNLCRAARAQVNVAVNASPVVNFPADTSSCTGSIVYNASWAGASYLWSTGATTATLNVTNNAQVAVSVTANGCTTVASSRALVAPAIVINRPDTTICGGSQTISLQGSPLPTYRWFDAPTGGNLVNTGQNYTSNFTTSATYYIDGQQALDTVVAGYTTLPTTSPSGYYAIPDTRGLIFDILQPLLLMSVEIPVQGGALSATLEIRNSANALLYSRPISLVAGTNTVAINYSIAAGTGYRIVLSNIIGAGTLHVGGGAQVTYPRTAGGLRLTSALLSGSANTSFHFFFYNFRLSQNVCTSARQAFNLTVNPSPVVNFPADTSSCTGSLTLNATWAGASYLWSTGATTATLNVTNNAQVAVSVTANGCTTVASSRVLVAAPISFSRADTTICGGSQTISLQGSPLPTYRWFDAPTGGNLVNTGQSYTSNFTTSATYYIDGQRALDTVVAGYTTLPTTSPSGYYAIPDTRGLIFNILQPLLLMSVEIPVQGGALSATLEIRNSTNALLYSRPVSLVAGTNTVAINYSIAAGTGYRIVLSNIIGAGTLHVGGGAQVTYPRTANGLQLTSALLSGSANTSFHFFFYNFRLSQNVCTSARQAFNLTVNPSPVLNFPNDTVVCGQTSFILDAANAGAAYLWSNGETTRQITLLTSGSASVLVNLNGCIVMDTSQVHLLDTVMFSVSDTTFCAGLHTLAINGSPNNTYLWWSAATAGGLDAVGSSYEQFFSRTDTFYVQGQTPLTTSFEGLPNNTLVNGTGSSLYPVSSQNGVGIVFTAYNEFLLKSVLIYADGLVQGNVELQAANGTVISRRAISLVSGANQVDINLYVPAAGNYRLVLRNATGGGRLFVDAPDQPRLLYPLNYNNIRMYASVINGVTTTAGYNGQIYSYFYNWEIVRLACPTSRYPMKVNILATPIIALPSDTVICGVSTVIDAASTNNIGASYLWATGQTTSSLNITNSGTWQLTATIGQCTDAHTINLTLANPPTQLNAPNDTTVCGGQLTLFSSGNGYTQAWYNTANATTPIAIADSLSFFINSNTTLWLEAVGFVPKMTHLGLAAPQTTFPANYVTAATLTEARGLEFDVLQPIRLDRVSLFTNAAAVQGKITLYDTYGFELQSQWVTLPAVGQNQVALNWVLVPNNGYRIVLDSLSGGGVYVEQIGFPFASNELRIQRGYPAALRGIYNFFYNWQISTLSCATARDSVVITIPPFPILTMPTDTASCDDSSPITISATNFNPAYTYRWSTGQTSNSIAATNSGYYTVTVSNGGVCNTIQNTFVQFLHAPAPLALADTVLCASGYAGLLQPINGQIYTWFDYISSSQQIHLGAPYYTYIADTTPFIVGNAARAVTRLGLQNSRTPADNSQYQGYNVPNTFNLNRWAVLDSVAVYPLTSPATFDLIIRDATGQAVYQQRFTTTRAKTKVFLPINAALPTGTNYQLEFANFNSKFLVDYSAVYPMTTSAQVATLTGTSFAGISYPCFFDWHFSFAAPNCAPADVDTFSVIPRLPLRLPADTVFVCDTFFANVYAPAAANYQWSNGATTAALALTNAGVYTVTVSDGAGCTGIDSLLITQPMPIGLTNANFNCGNELGHNYSNLAASSFLWNTSDTTANLFLQNGAGVYSLTVTTLDGCILSDTANLTFIEPLPVFSLGNPRNLCVGDSLQVALPSNNYNYIWSTGSTTNRAIITGSNNYLLTVTSPNGCSATDQVVINAQARPIANFNVFYQQGLDIGVTNLCQNYNLYYYNYGDSSPITSASFHSYDTVGCYTVFIVAQSGCGSDTFSRQINIGNVVCDTTISVARLATENNFVLLPNPNDGAFSIKFERGYAEATPLLLYNAQGQHLHSYILPAQTEQLQLNIQDLQLPAGVYFLHWPTPQGAKTKQFILLQP